MLRKPSDPGFFSNIINLYFYLGIRRDHPCNPYCPDLPLQPAVALVGAHHPYRTDDLHPGRHPVVLVSTGTVIPIFRVKVNLAVDGDRSSPGLIH